MRLINTYKELHYIFENIIKEIDRQMIIEWNTIIRKFKFVSNCNYLYNVNDL